MIYEKNSGFSKVRVRLLSVSITRGSGQGPILMIEPPPSPGHISFGIMNSFQKLKARSRSEVKAPYHTTGHEPDVNGCGGGKNGAAGPATRGRHASSAKGGAQSGGCKRVHSDSYSPKKAGTIKRKRYEGVTCNDKKPSAKSQKNEPTAEVERRPFPFRRGAGTFRDRLFRAINQGMYLIHNEDLSTEGNLHRRFHVSGTTGNVYHVDICRIPTCDCPDFVRHTIPGQAGVVCKHILLVYLKVLRLASNDTLLPQKGLLQDELTRMFACLPGKGGEEDEKSWGDVLVDAKARAAYTALVDEAAAGDAGAKKDKGQQTGDLCLDLAREDECPVCLEQFDTQKPEEVVTCYACHKPTHALCFRTWNGVKISEGLPRSCVWCRARWLDPVLAGASDGAKARAESQAGYVNVGKLTGQAGREEYQSMYSRWRNRWW